MKNSHFVFTAAGLFLATCSSVLALLDPVTGVVVGSNVSAINGAVDVDLNGVTFVNHGLVGVGRIDADSVDAWGESLGSVSGLQLGNWIRTGPNAYAGSFYILPDRGYNSAPNFSNYAGRIQKVDFTFRPEKGGGFKGSGAAQDQFTFLYDAAGSVKFSVHTDDDQSGVFKPTTGLVPDNVSLLGGKIVPFVTKSNGTSGWLLGTKMKFISLNARSFGLFVPTAFSSEKICAIMASEFGSNGRREMSSFHPLSRGKICKPAITASASGVLNRMALVTTGIGPRMRPAWLMRSAAREGIMSAARRKTTRPNDLIANTRS